jgi:hypothetical protein
MVGTVLFTYPSPHHSTTPFPLIPRLDFSCSDHTIAV